MVPLLLRRALGAFAYAPQAFGTRWAWCFGWGRAIGRRPNHCFTRCNRTDKTNKTANGACVGPFGLMVHKPALDQPDACISLSRLSGTRLEQFRVDS